MYIYRTHILCYRWHIQYIFWMVGSSWLGSKCFTLHIELVPTYARMAQPIWVFAPHTKRWFVKKGKLWGKPPASFAAVWWLWLLVVLPHHPYRVYGLCQRSLSAFLVFLRKTTNRLLMKHADQLQLGCLWVIEPLWLNVTLVSLGNL